MNEPPLPFSEDAEKALLCCLYRSQEARGTVCPNIKPELFYLESHRILYEDIQKAVQNGAGLDWISVTDRLAADLGDVGGKQYISDLWSFVPVAAGFDSYVKILVEKWKLRTLILSSNRTIVACLDLSTDTRGIITEIRDTLASVEINIKQPGKTALEVHHEFLDVLEKRQSGQEQAVPNPWAGLSSHIDALRPGDVLIVGGDTGSGKSAFAITWARHALGHGIPVLYITLEMAAEQIQHRWVAQLSRINSFDIRRGKLTPAGWKLVGQCSAQVAEWPFVIIDDNSLDIGQLGAACANHFSGDRGGLIVFDYLQLVRPVRVGRGVSRQQEVADISARIKAIAKDCKVPVIALSQLNEAGYTREARDIQNDADYVLIIKNTEDNHVRDIHITKNRHGERYGTVPLGFRGHLTEFYDTDKAGTV